MNDSFGARLRRERERRHISLASIAASTKINASLFEQLERDNVSRWPSGIFRRSFMRAYAGAIGLDADETVREFLERFPDPAAPAPVHAVTTAVPGVPDSPLPPSALRLTLAETGGRPFTGSRVLSGSGRRWTAAAWDAGVLLVLALTAFVVFGRFWQPLAVASFAYYMGGILLLGNTPGVYLFAPRVREAADEVGTAQPRPARVRREPRVRAAHARMNPFRSVRRSRSVTTQP